MSYIQGAILTKLQPHRSPYCYHSSLIFPVSGPPHNRRLSWLNKTVKKIRCWHQTSLFFKSFFFFKSFTTSHIWGFLYTFLQVVFLSFIFFYFLSFCLTARSCVGAWRAVGLSLVWDDTQAPERLNGICDVTQLSIKLTYVIRGG